MLFLLALILAADWLPLSFQDGSTLQMPGAASRVYQSAAELGRSRESFTCDFEGYRFTATMTEVPGAADGGEGIARNDAEFMASDMHGQLVRLEPASRGTLTGWELEFRRRRREDIWYVLWIADDRRSVQLTLVAPLEKPSRATARRFFESLELSGGSGSAGRGSGSPGAPSASSPRA